MALIVSGGLAPTVSGKVGNSVWSRNRGGAYIRNYAKPTNPATALQNAVRATFSALVSLWQAYTPARRAQWGTSAAQVANPNRVGLTSNPPPLALFQQVNVGRVLAGLPVVEDSPPMPLTIDWGADAANFGSATGLGSNLLIVEFDASKSWVSDNNAGLIIYLSPSPVLSQSINFYKGPWNFVGVIKGDSGSPPTSPTTLTLDSGFPGISTAQNRFYKAYVSTGSGNLGTTVTGRLADLT